MAPLSQWGYDCGYPNRKVFLMRQTGLVGKFRFLLLAIGFALFVFMSIESAHNMASPGAIGTHRFAQDFSTSQLGKLLKSGSLVTADFKLASTSHDDTNATPAHRPALAVKPALGERVATVSSNQGGYHANGHKAILISTPPSSSKH